MEFAEILKNLSENELEDIYTYLICLLRELEFKDNPTLFDKISIEIILDRLEMIRQH
jgi:hypothetical protein